MARFYPNGSAAPNPLPTYMVETPSGAWVVDTGAEVINLVRQLTANGIPARGLRVKP
jgi:hypothetical protein